MEAVWLVCYGFESFRHQKFCETLRQEPDYKEGGEKFGTAQGAAFISNLKVDTQSIHTWRGSQCSEFLGDVGHKGVRRGDAPTVEAAEAGRPARSKCRWVPPCACSRRVPACYYITWPAQMHVGQYTFMQGPQWKERFPSGASTNGGGC